jgi:hypothetical protein
MRIIFIFFIGLVVLSGDCVAQRLTPRKGPVTKEGILVYYMNEPYFFPIKDTSLEMLSRSSLIGVKLGRIDLNDIFEKISHKTDIIIYAAGKNNKIDTVKSQVGILSVKMETVVVNTKLSLDTAAFNFEYRQNTWGLFKYTLGFNVEVKSIQPILAQDIQKHKTLLKELGTSQENE